MTDKAGPEQADWHPAREGGRRSLPGLFLLALVALVLSLAGMAPKSADLARQAAQSFDQEDGQFGLLTAARQESGRVAHALRPQAKAVFASAGSGDPLVVPVLPAVLLAGPVTAAPFAAGHAVIGDAHPPGQPRAPPASSVTA